ncbi:uncharacterized protein BDZ83DRAFT_648276 [Colletotrichum acutatum]|uniref:Uncharacterized protein n=1 Tax=Glomerella acutata TaxID=27357 RepID=A0AAD8XKB4_GLOAC|nr:uncharacterized protein BDZ83DRAFT_648276 [Colletotrichum acutatum]KAK1728940.1 hypothetical protein BDZ83DRAFT_648276 [Colletotrichum acutatum]
MCRAIWRIAGIEDVASGVQDSAPRIGFLTSLVCVRRLMLCAIEAPRLCRNFVKRSVWIGSDPVSRGHNSRASWTFRDWYGWIGIQGWRAVHGMGVVGQGGQKSLHCLGLVTSIDGTSPFTFSKVSVVVIFTPAIFFDPRYAESPTNIDYLSLVDLTHAACRKRAASPCSYTVPSCAYGPTRKLHEISSLPWLPLDLFLGLIRCLGSPLARCISRWHYRSEALLPTLEEHICSSVIRHRAAIGHLFSLRLVFLAFFWLLPCYTSRFISQAFFCTDTSPETLFSLDKHPPLGGRKNANHGNYAVQNLQQAWYHIFARFQTS